MAPLPAPFAPKGTAMAEVAPATLVYAEASSSLPVTDHTTTPSLETGSLIEDIANTIAPEIANALEASLESFDEVSSISSEPTDITSDAVFQTWVPTELASLDIPDVAGSSEAPTQAVAVSKPIESSHVTPPAPTHGASTSKHKKHHDGFIKDWNLGPSVGVIVGGAVGCFFILILLVSLFRICKYY